MEMWRRGGLGAKERTNHGRAFRAVLVFSQQLQLVQLVLTEEEKADRPLEIAS